MGGVQAKEDTVVEVHAVRGGQLILRASPTSSRFSSSNSSSSSSLNSIVAGGGGGGGGGSGTRSGPPPLIKRESKLSLILPGKCLITSQHVDIMEKVLKYLTPRDLAFLSLTCRAMHVLVMNYVRHHNYKLRLQIRSFYEEHSELLLPKEVVFRERIECNSNHDLLLFSAKRQFNCTIRRISLAKILEFDGRDDEDNSRVMCERDVSMKRDVVVVRGVTSMRYRHVFSNVGPGRHILRMRMRFSDAPWGREIPPVCPTYVTASRLLAVHDPTKTSQSSSYPESAVLQRTPLVSQPVPPHLWVAARTRHPDRHYPMDIGRNASFTFERDTDWFFVCMAPFVIQPEHSKNVDIEVLFDDTDNPASKWSCVWDFMELRTEALAP